MAVKVAINGFGRIGRLAFRQMFGAEGFEIVAINDLTSPEMLAHLLKYDSTQGRYALCDKVSFGEDSITVDGKKITIYKEADAKNLPWGTLGVDVVLECTGFYTSKDKAQAHIDAGAKHVIISAPAGNDLPTIVYNVNHTSLTKDDKVSKVSIVGAGMESHPGVAAKMFEALYDADINIRMIATSEIRISVLIDEADTQKAVQSVHDAFIG
ncbi:MAG: ACT domain-containing protein [Lachnospiraceae bacterium]|nr:ACT domain-containing protein [Lachnospiraceae bacterium]